MGIGETAKAFWVACVQIWNEIPDIYKEFVKKVIRELLIILFRDFFDSSRPDPEGA